MHFIICGLYCDYVPIILCIISPLPSEIIEIMSVRFSDKKREAPLKGRRPLSKF